MTEAETSFTNMMTEDMKAWMTYGTSTNEYSVEGWASNWKPPKVKKRKVGMKARKGK